MSATIDLVELLKDLPPLLTESQVEAQGIAKRQTLANWRCTKRGGPPFTRIGGSIRYPKDKLIAWIISNTVTPVAV